MTAELSQGVYRIPYVRGTTVRIGNDHLTHNPKNRIDMEGVGGPTPYRIVAAADGVIRFIVDKFSENRPGQKPCNNNYVWIEHPNGEWTKYSHLAQHSVRRDAGLSEGQAVRGGTFLGFEDDVGCARGTHLHFEVGVPDDPKHPIDEDGFLTNGSVNRVPRVCGLPGGIYVEGQSLVAGIPVFSEYARHGVPDDKYQQVFDQARNCGYRPRWIDAFRHDGETFFNLLCQRNDPPRGWAAHSRMTSAEYQERAETYFREGLHITHVEVYTVQGHVRYAAIFEETGGQPPTAYHDKTADEHERALDALVSDGFRPRQISVASNNGDRVYAALYTRGSIGSWNARSFLDADEYQAQFDANAADNRRLIYLNCYTHDGGARFSAIWSSEAPSNVRARHAMSSGEYQQEWETNTSRGWRTAAVTGYEENGHVRYAAYWTK